VRLVRPFGADRVEAAAMRAIEIGTLTYGSVRSITAPRAASIARCSISSPMASGSTRTTI